MKKFKSIIFILFILACSTGSNEDEYYSNNNNNQSNIPGYNISVTANGMSDYRLSGRDRDGSVSGNDPSIKFKVGDQINFNVNASGHPFYLKTKSSLGTSDQINGVTNQGTSNGSVSWKPTSAGTFYYVCSKHTNMFGTITVIN